jgi:putative membrane protein
LPRIDTVDRWTSLSAPGIMQTDIDRLDDDAIQGAVRRAEERTAGEIVPVVVARSANYEVATWRGAAVAMLLALAGGLLVLQIDPGGRLGAPSAPWIVVGSSLTVGAMGALAATLVAPLRRLFAGHTLLAEAVRRRALQFFVQEEVFATRDRTGILLFVSLLERQVEVIGDTGIDDRVRADDWEAVAARVQKGIRTGSLTDALVEAIEMCGRLLERRGVNVRPDDENELSDAVRTQEHPDEDGPSESDDPS